jgi:hypothetical protein
VVAGGEIERQRRFALERESMSDTEMEWEDFKREAASLLTNAKAEGSIVLFRGQASNNWRLETTLERSELSYEVADHFRTILRIKPEVEAFTGLKWSENPSTWDIEQDLLGGYELFGSRLLRGEMPHYSYLAYLRHHGFPSPLLDWSASPMVAAFFAFRTPSDSDWVAIYAYRERDASGMKSGGSDEPYIPSARSLCSGTPASFCPTFLLHHVYTMAKGLPLLL